MDIFGVRLVRELGHFEVSILGEAVRIACRGWHREVASHGIEKCYTLLILPCHNITCAAGPCSFNFAIPLFCG